MLFTRLVESSKVLARMGGMVGGSLEVLLGCLPRVDRQRDGSESVQSRHVSCDTCASNHAVLTSVSREVSRCSGCLDLPAVGPRLPVGAHGFVWFA